MKLFKIVYLGFIIILKSYDNMRHTPASNVNWSELLFENHPRLSRDKWMKQKKAYRIPAGYLLTGYQNNSSTVIRFLQNARTRIGACVDSVTPIVSDVG
jgi:hypothetical protein